MNPAAPVTNMFSKRSFPMTKPTPDSVFGVQPRVISIGLSRAQAGSRRRGGGNTHRGIPRHDLVAPNRYRRRAYRTDPCFQPPGGKRADGKRMTNSATTVVIEPEFLCIRS